VVQRSGMPSDSILEAIHKPLATPPVPSGVHYPDNPRLKTHDIINWQSMWAALDNRGHFQREHLNRRIVLYGLVEGGVNRSNRRIVCHGFGECHVNQSSGKLSALPALVARHSITKRALRRLGA
jgi:hypothetical protein